jgi:L-ascorbate metabolism protein UlaG (beta-lactamase superfamily)
MSGCQRVTSTHSHTDHLDAETLTPLFSAASRPTQTYSLVVPLPAEALAYERTNRLNSVYIRSMRAWEREKVDGFMFLAVPAAHEDLAVDEHGNNLYLGYVVKIGEWVVYHAGDTVVFDGMAEGLQSLGIDIAILPINGKVGNMNGRDAARLARDINARLVIPCHYDMFEFNTADPADEFIPECKRLGQPCRVLRLGERFSSDELSRR